MCGIAGVVKLGPTASADTLAELAAAMTDRLVHRGPDDSGVFVDPAANLALGFRRLSILDLSREGHQPMRSVSGRYQLIFNGEIYNFRHLRSELEKRAHRFRGHSDTEVLLAAIDEWGLTTALRRANGMIGLALWDAERRELSLARDRAGKKPLYYGWVNGYFAFASELKAIRALPDFQAPINRDALTLLLRHNYIPAPYSIHDGLFKLRQAEVLTLPLASLAQRRDLDGLARYSRRFWSFDDAVRSGSENTFGGDDREATEQLDARLQNAVRERLVADVPLGALLSGGIDSTIVTALMQAASPAPVKTFSIGFHERDYNEAEYAGQVAAHLGTNHTEMYVSPDEAMAVIPDLPAIYDEPLADVSQVPTFLVSRLARGSVTVALSGDGGDELFAGYTRYLFANKLVRAFGMLPTPGRRLASSAIQGLSAENWDRVLGLLGPLIPGALKVSPGDKLHKVAPLLAQGDPVAIYRDLFSQWRDPAAAVKSASEPATPLTDPTGRPPVRDFIERMMQLDCVSYLPENILTKVDRASMAVSLEVRCPLLDPDVIDFAWRLPLRFKVRDGKGKWLLRQVLHRYVPKALVERPKMGFDVPVGRWLKGDLRDWAEDLLDERKLVEQGFFNPGPIRCKWREHLNGTRNWQYPLWNVLMFQAWLEHASQQPSSSRNYGSEVAETATIT